MLGQKAQSLPAPSEEKPRGPCRKHVPQLPTTSHTGATPHPRACTTSTNDGEGVCWPFTRDTDIFNNEIQVQYLLRPGFLHREDEAATLSSASCTGS